MSFSLGERKFSTGEASGEAAAAPAVPATGYPGAKKEEAKAAAPAKAAKVTKAAPAKAAKVTKEAAKAPAGKTIAKEQKAPAPAKKAPPPKKVRARVVTSAREPRATDALP